MWKHRSGLWGVHRHLARIVPGENRGPRGFPHFSRTRSERGRKGTPHVLTDVPALRTPRRSDGRRWSYGRGCVTNTFCSSTASTRRISSSPSYVTGKTLATSFSTWIRTRRFPALAAWYRPRRWSPPPPTRCSKIVFKAP